ncbi:hypothetical protein J7L67_07615, partial [bacterium]|nr:hypothetical protein [bacterium]
VNPYVTSQLIKTISSGFIVSYESFLKDNNVGQLDELIRKLDKKMSAFMDKTIVLEGGHLILTDNINSVECYEHIYFRQMSFAHNGATARLISESVPVSALDGLVQRLKDVRAIRRVIYLFDLKRFLASYVSYEIIPGYAATEMQIDTIKDHIALILYDYFSVMLDKYSLFLSDKYAEANMQNLVAYIDELHSVTPTSIFGITEVDRSIRRDLHRILKVLNNDYEKPGQTAFYRNYDHWYNQYRRYLTDVIAQKADAGDFTFSLRSIGSSTGKEAYSIASILEQELENYAYDHVFKNIMNNDERRQKSKKWVDLWSVKVYAIDMNIQSLTVSAQGLYRTDEHWVDFIGTYPEYKDKFNDFTIAGEPLADTIVVDNRLRKWIVPVYADLDDGLGVLERYPAEVTFAMNMIPYLNYAEPFMTKLTVKQIASYKAFVVFNEIFASVPNNHYFLDQQPFTLPMTKHLSKTDIARAVYIQNLEFARQTVDFWGIKAQRLSDIVSASILFDENGLKPIAADLVAKLLANTPAQGTSLADHEYFLNTSFRNFMENYVINLFRNNFTADNIRNILNIIKDNMVSCYSRKLQLSKNENARTLSVNLGKRLEDFLSAADILPKGILILPVLFDGEMYYEETFVDKQAFLADIQIDGVFPTVSQVIPQRTRDNIVARQSQLKYIDKILKISGFKNRFIDSYKDIYTNDNKEVLLYRIQNASLDYFENMVFRYKPLLQSKYANADLANLSDYIEDLIRNTDHIAQPEDKDILADIQSFGKETAKGFVQPENEKFFNGSVFWKEDFLNYLEHLIAEKTILNDFTLSVRSLGSLTGKESYSIALLVERTMLAYAQRYVYGNVRSVNDRDRLSKKWLQKWDIRIFALDSNLYNLALIKEGVYNISKDGKDLTSENQGNINIFESMKLVGKDYQSTGRVKLLFRNWIIPVYTHLETDLSVLERCPAEITFAFDIGVADDSQLHDKLRNTVNPFFKSYLVYNKTLGTKAVDIGLIDGQPHVLPAQKKPTEQAIMQIIDSSYGLSLSSFEEIAGFFGISLNDLNDILEHNQPQPDKKTDNLQKALSLINLMI